MFSMSKHNYTIAVVFEKLKPGGGWEERTHLFRNENEIAEHDHWLKDVHAKVWYRLQPIRDQKVGEMVGQSRRHKRLQECRRDLINKLSRREQLDNEIQEAEARLKDAETQNS